MGEVEGSITQSLSDLAWKMHQAVVLWRLEICRVALLRRRVADSVGNGLASQNGGC